MYGVNVLECKVYVWCKCLECKVYVWCKCPGV